MKNRNKLVIEPDFNDNKNSDKYNFDYIVAVLEKKNINIDKVLLFHEFSINLHICIEETYLGEDYIKTIDYINGHFKWCFYNTISKYEEQGVSFRDNLELFDLFKKIYFDDFYKRKNDILNMWNQIFDFKNFKNKMNVDDLYKIYCIFNKNF